MSHEITRWTRLVVDTSIIYPSLVSPRDQVEEKILDLLVCIIVSQVIDIVQKHVRSTNVLQILPHVYVPEAVRLELAMKLLVCVARCRHCNKTFTLPDYSRKARCPYCGTELRIEKPYPVEKLEKAIEKLRELIVEAYREALERAHISIAEVYTPKHRLVRVRPIDTYLVSEKDLASEFVHLCEPRISDILDLAIELRRYHEELVQRKYELLPKSMSDYLMSASALHLALDGETVCLVSVGRDLGRYVEVARRYAKHVHNREVHLHHVDLRDLYPTTQTR